MLNACFEVNQNFNYTKQSPLLPMSPRADGYDGRHGNQDHAQSHAQRREQPVVARRRGHAHFLGGHTHLRRRRSLVYRPITRSPGGFLDDVTDTCTMTSSRNVTYLSGNNDCTSSHTKITSGLVFKHNIKITVQQ